MPWGTIVACFAFGIAAGIALAFFRWMALQRSNSRVEWVLIGLTGMFVALSCLAQFGQVFGTAGFEAAGIDMNRMFAMAFGGNAAACLMVLFGRRLQDPGK